MEVHIYSVKDIQYNIFVKDITTTQKGQIERKSTRNLKNLCILSKNSAKGIEARREFCWGYVSIYENTSKKLP